MDLDEESMKNLLIQGTLFMVFLKYVHPLIVWLVDWAKLLYHPINYELDMTTGQYCRTIAEVHNTLVKKAKFEDIEELMSDNLSSHDKAPQYPNGWLPIMESTKIKPGEIKSAIMLGRDVIVSRSFEGKVSVLDAYCPHMGVHIGVGGQVVDFEGKSCIQCPFHGWTYDMVDGRCVRIPYSSTSYASIPKQARLKAWQCCEVDHFIYIWHHIDNQPPDWFLEPTPELESGEWALAGRSCHKSYLDSSDMLENGADMHHFEGIHNDLFLFGGNLMKLQAFSHLQKYFRHCWDPEWKPVLDDEGRVTHKAKVRLDSWIKLFALQIFFIQVRALQIGPASVTLRYNSNWYGPGVLKMNAIQLGGRQTMYVQHIYTKNHMFNRLMAKLVLYGEVKQLERDLLMWNHRKYLKHPVLVPEDKVIKRFRHWYAQFYRRKQTIIVQNVDSN